MAEGKAKARYSALSPTREPYLQRARKAAELTIPSILPPSGFSGTSQLYTPYQSVGAQGVRSASAKLTTTVFATPFFRLEPTEEVVAEVTSTHGPSAKDEMQTLLAGHEKKFMRQVEAAGDRVAVDAAMQQTVVAGNVLIDLTKPRMRTHKLDSYVVARDPRGDVIEIVILEIAAKDSLPSEQAAMVDEKVIGNGVKGIAGGSLTPVEIYTHVILKGGFYFVHQEIAGKVVAKSRGKYKKDFLPYIALRFTRIDGEDYGRGYVEEVLGDLSSLETLSTAIVEGAAVAAKIVFLVSPNGNTKVKSLIEVENGGFVSGSRDDVTVLQMDKQADFQIAERMMQTIEARLERAFMLHASVKRDAERVTATEIRYLAEELDIAFSGIYSILSIEFQQPYIKLKMDLLVRNKKLKSLPKGTVDPIIITGLAALDRGKDLQALDMFIAGLKDTFGPEVIAKEVNFTNYATRRAAATGLDTTGLFYTAEEKSQTQKNDQMQALAATAGPAAMKEIANGATQGQGPAGGQ